MTTETGGNKSTSCCSKVRSWGWLGWFLGPITYDFGLSCSTILYFFIMIPLSLGLSIYTTVTYSLFVGFIALFCIGIPLLYLNSEITIGIVRFLILAPTYGLLETDKIGNEKKVYLAVQNGMPLCNTCCEKGSKLSRPKFIFTSLKFYKMIFYNILVAPVCTWFFGSTILLVAPPLYLMHHVFRYPFNASYYHNKNECIGNQNGTKSCQGWLISNYGDCIACFLIGFLLLPLVLRLVNNSGQICKKIMYYFLTNYYNPMVPSILNDGDEVIVTNTRGTVQLNETNEGYNVQFVDGNTNYRSTDTNNDLVAV